MKKENSIAMPVINEHAAGIDERCPLAATPSFARITQRCFYPLFKY